MKTTLPFASINETVHNWVQLNYWMQLNKASEIVVVLLLVLNLFIILENSLVELIMISMSIYEYFGST